MFDLRHNPYLEQEVVSASPAKLRWLLINKSVQLCRIIDKLWQDSSVGAEQYSIWLRDVLNELLSGVHGQDDLARRVSDLYIYMVQQLNEAEQNKNRQQLGQLQSLLEVEAETWFLVQQKFAAGSAASSIPAPNLMKFDSVDGAFCVDA